MSGWQAVLDEVSQWHASGLRLPLWWRDDDAVAVTPQLERLRQQAVAAKLPVHLAVIPALATTDLALYTTAEHRFLKPIVHGWTHENHAPAGVKKSEFGTWREDALADATLGFERACDLFAGHMQPVFVPPWNRLHPDILALLPKAGYQVVSTFSPRTTSHPAVGIEQINTHLDPVDWHGTRGLADTDRLLSGLCAQLQARRTGKADNREPYGLLTHHLIHDEDVWTFCAALIEALAPISDPVTHLTETRT